MSELLKAIGHQIRALRKGKKSSLKSVAAKSGLTPGLLRNVEAGRESVSIDTLHIIASALGISVYAILGHAVRMHTETNSKSTTNGPGRAILYEKLGGMDEASLRRNVLAPLFRAMGFEHVAETHGNILEQGRDFVLWERGRTGTPMCIGVVVKAGDINGSAESHAGTAATVAFQIRQCLGRTWPHPKTLVAMPVNRCWIIASGEIKKEARHSLESALDLGTLARIEFADGNDLYGLIEEHLGPATALDLLQQAASRMQNIAPEGHDVITFASIDGTVGVSVHPKPGVDPITFSLSISESDDTSNSAKVQAVVNALKYGGEVTSKDGVTVDLAPSAFIAAMLPAGESFDSWKMHAIPKPQHIVVTFAAMREGELVARWPHVIVSIIRSGEQTLKWTVDDSREALAFDFAQGEDGNKFNISVGSHSGDAWKVDAVRLHHSISFFDALKNADRLRIVDDRSGMTLAETAGPFIGDGNIGEAFKALCKAAANVQLQLQRRIFIPREGLLPSLTQDILHLSALVNREIIRLSVTQASLLFHGGAAEAADWIERYSKGTDDSAVILQVHGVSYALPDGPVSVVVNDLLIGACLDAESIRALQARAEAGLSSEARPNAKNGVPLRFVAAPDSMMRVERSLADEIISKLDE